MATMVMAPLPASFCARCGSGLASRIRSNGASQAGVSARAANGAAEAAISAAAAIRLIAPEAKSLPCTEIPQIPIIGFASDVTQTAPTVRDCLLIAAIHGRFDLPGRPYHQIGQQPAYAFMNVLGYVK